MAFTQLQARSYLNMSQRNPSSTQNMHVSGTKYPSKEEAAHATCR